VYALAIPAVLASAHSYVELPGYGHLDVIMGRDAARDIFPKMLAELER
jgi:hypothetical protein